MSSLLAALANGGNALREFEKAVSLTQTDVVNASTPGYAAQQLQFVATPYAADTGLYGGVQVAGIESTRDDFAEAAVRRQASQEGFYSQQAETLASIEAAFDVGSSGGLSSSIQSLFNAFSAWSQQPNDGNAREQVIAAAGNVAVGFRQAAQQIQDTATQGVEQAQTLVAKINDIGQQLAQINKAMRQSGGDSSSIDAEVYSKLEDLSSITTFTVTRASDNTLTVLLNGQTPLVIGDHSYQLQATSAPSSNAGSPPTIQISDISGNVTSQFTTGSLGGIIQSVNNDIANLLGGNGPNGSVQNGSLNDLAIKFATRVNDILYAGRTAADPTPAGAAGAPLFTLASDGSAAATLDITNITPDQLAAIQPGPPSVANGIATQLAGLLSSTDPLDQVHGASYLDYYGQIASQVGSASSAAQTNHSRYSQLASQARSLRSEVSGVSLDEEAVRLVEFQRAYDATARTISTLNQMLDTLMQLGQ
jgi:flagellar hook-associated protein 1 FlgK